MAVLRKFKRRANSMHRQGWASGFILLGSRTFTTEYYEPDKGKSMNDKKEDELS
jgi:hypothetical protein